MSVEPRLVKIPSGADANEWFMKNHLADGLPVVLPTQSRVKKMIDAAHPRSRRDALGTCPPSHDIVTIEAAAVAAVMAGCEPKHFTVVLAAVEAALSTTFNFHGNHATTMGCAPCIIVSGPLSSDTEINGGLGCLGSGTRANATIGRALKLVLFNVGGARLGGSESSTLGSPAKFTFCFAENEDSLVALGSWKPYRTELPPGASPHGAFGPSDTSVTIIPTVGFSTIVDFQVRIPEELVEWIAWTVVSGWATRLGMLSSGLLILSPEHYELVSRKFQTRKSFQEALWRKCNELMSPHVGAIIANLKFPDGGFCHNKSSLSCHSCPNSHLQNRTVRWTWQLPNASLLRWDRQYRNPFRLEPNHRSEI